MAINSASFNFFDPTNPLLNVKIRNMNGNHDGDKFKALHFFVTELDTTTNPANIIRTVLLPNQPPTGFDYNDIIAYLSTSTGAEEDPEQDRGANSSNTSALTISYSNSDIYVDTNTATNKSVIISNFNSLVDGVSGVGFTGANNLNIEINLKDLYTFNSFRKYSVEVFGELVGSTPGQLLGSWTWDHQASSTITPTNINSTADLPQTLYVPNIDSSDIDFNVTPYNDSLTDWGYAGVSALQPYLLVAMIFPGGQLANSTNYSLDLFDTTAATPTPFQLPLGSRAMLVEATPTGSYDTNNNYITDTISFVDTTFGTTSSEFSFDNVDTTQAVTLGFYIPNTSNTFIVGDSYSATLRNATSGLNVADSGSSVMACLYEDSEVLTPSGYVSVKQLQNGDLVTTSDGRTSRIVNIMKSKMPATENTSPIIIPANSIAENYPPKDCRISKYHMIQYNGNWIAPLKNKHIFKADKSIRSVKYYHIQLENYYTDHLVINGGLIVESLGNGERDNTAEWDARVNNSIIL